MANVIPLKPKAASRDGAGAVTATPTAIQEFETGDVLPIAFGGTGAATASAARALFNLVDESNFNLYIVVETSVTMGTTLLSSTSTGMSKSSSLNAQNIQITTTATNGSFTLTAPTIGTRSQGQFITHIIAASGGSLTLTLPSSFKVKTAGTVVIASGTTCLMVSYFDGTNFYTFYELSMVAP